MSKALYSYLFLIVITVFISSCGGDEPSFILGTWQLDRFNFVCTDGLDIIAQGDNGCVDFMDSNLCLTFIFKEDNTGEFIVNDDGTAQSGPFNYMYTENNSFVSICNDSGDCEDLDIINDEIYFDEKDSGCVLHQILVKT